MNMKILTTSVLIAMLGMSGPLWAKDPADGHKGKGPTAGHMSEEGMEHEQGTAHQSEEGAEHQKAVATDEQGSSTEDQGASSDDQKGKKNKDKKDKKAKKDKKNKKETDE